MLSKFKGELSHIDPRRIITQDAFNKVENFFLILGVVFNDLKGLILFGKMLKDTYEKPTIDEPTSHLGNYTGTIVQLNKLLAATINEFFIFLEKNIDTFTEKEFQEVIMKLSKADRELWVQLVGAATGNLPSATGFLKIIVQIRNNVAYHFDHSGKTLRGGYVSYFLEGKEGANRKFAYYSLGESVELTRFYFSDAAVEEAIKITAEKSSDKGDNQELSFQKYQDQTWEAVDVMANTITSLMKNFIQLRRAKTH